MKKIVSIVFLMIIGLILTGCMGKNPETYLKNVSVGMTKEQVYTIGIEPTLISADGNVENLIYDRIDPLGGYIVSYYVRLINNKVVSFGQFNRYYSASPSNNNDGSYSSTVKCTKFGTLNGQVQEFSGAICPIGWSKVF